MTSSLELFDFAFQNVGMPRAAPGLEKRGMVILAQNSSVPSASCQTLKEIRNSWDETNQTKQKQLRWSHSYLFENESRLVSLGKPKGPSAFWQVFSWKHNKPKKHKNSSIILSKLFFQ